MSRITSLNALILFALSIGVGEAQAQRSGFIIGFGLGPGITSIGSGVPGGERESRTGVSTDFRIGGVIGESVQLYYVNKVQFSADDFADLLINGISGLGVTYVPATAQRLHLSGGIGIAVFGILEDSEVESFTGPGFTGGIGYEFVKNLILDFGITYGSPRDDFDTSVGIWQGRLGINILSH